MSRYIDADALTKKFGSLMKRYAAQGRTEVAQDYNWVCTVLDAAPTADVVEVVRCRDCAWARKVDNREPMFRCVNICRYGCTQWLDSNDFCSYGERRSE